MPEFAGGGECCPDTHRSIGRLVRLSLATTNEVTEYEPNRRFAWKATSWHARDDNVGFRAVRPQHQSHVHAGGGGHWLLGLAEPVMEGLANGPVDNDQGALKELLAITRTAAGTAKGW